MDFVENSMQDMLHKIKLMMIRDSQMIGFDNPFDDKDPQIKDSLMRDIDQEHWDEADECF